MPDSMQFEYFFGEESTQFSFFKVPCQLITGPQFRQLSNDAKLLYAMLLDRMSLSARNGWYDDQGRVYIYYTVDEIRRDLNCGNDKALKMLAELGHDQGRRPDRAYQVGTGQADENLRQAVHHPHRATPAGAGALPGAPGDGTPRKSKPRFSRLPPLVFFDFCPSHKSR